MQNVNSSGREHQVLTVLARLAQRRPENTELLRRALRTKLERLAEPALDVAVETGDPIGLVLAELIRSHPNPGLASRLHDRIPAGTVALQEVGIEITRQAAEASIRSKRISRRAVALLSNLSQRLVEAGQFDSALELAREAERRLEQLVAGGRGSPDLYLGLSRTFSDCGEHLRAIELLRAIIPQLEKSALSRRRKASVDLAHALHNLGAALSESGDNISAVDPLEKAVEVRRVLALRGGIQSRAELANSLTVSAALWTELGELKEGLSREEEAVELWRDIADRDPDAYKALLAKTLANLAGTYSELRDFARAAGTAREALDVFERIGAVRWQAFGGAMVATARTLSGATLELGDGATALQAAEKAVEIARELTPRDHPNRLWTVADALAAQSRALRYAGRRPDAAAALRESLEIRRKLAQYDPGQYLPELANALNNLANAGSASDGLEDSVALAREAVHAYRRLHEREPRAYAGKLAVAIDTLGLRLADRVAYRQAVRKISTACVILEGPYVRLPRVYGVWMTTLIRHLELLTPRVPRAAAWRAWRQVASALLRRRCEPRFRESARVPADEHADIEGRVRAGLKRFRHRGAPLIWADGFRLRYKGR